jgi:hypothetical protein
MEEHNYIQYFVEFQAKRTRRRWENNIKMELREVGYEDVSCTELVHNTI